MSWMGPMAKNGAKLAVKYGPQAKLAWDHVGKDAMQGANRSATRQLMRRRAFAKAATVREGAVLRQLDGDEVVFVVLSEGEPIATYPAVETDLAALLAKADLTKAVTSEEFERKRLRARTQRLRRARRARSRSIERPEAD